jgi:hypothetical protein
LPMGLAATQIGTSPADRPALAEVRSPVWLKATVLGIGGLVALMSLGAAWLWLRHGEAVFLEKLMATLATCF